MNHFYIIISFTKKSIIFYEIIGFTKRIYYFYKSSVLLNKFTNTSPYRQTTFLLLKFQGLRFLYFIINFIIFIRINDFLSKIGPIWALMGPQAPYGPI